MLKEVGCYLGKGQLKTSLGLGRQHHSSSEQLLARLRAKVFLLEVQGAQGGDL